MLAKDTGTQQRSTTAPWTNLWARNTDTRTKTRLLIWILVETMTTKLEKRKY